MGTMKSVRSLNIMVAIKPLVTVFIIITNNITRFISHIQMILNLTSIIIKCFIYFLVHFLIFFTIIHTALNYTKSARLQFILSIIIIKISLGWIIFSNTFSNLI